MPECWQKDNIFHVTHEKGRKTRPQTDEIWMQEVRSDIFMTASYKAPMLFIQTRNCNVSLSKPLSPTANNKQDLIPLGGMHEERSSSSLAFLASLLSFGCHTSQRTSLTDTHKTGQETSLCRSGSHAYM